VTRLEAHVARQGSALHLRYVMAGRIGDLLLPPPGAPSRADGLWRRTCFEAFVRPAGEGYVEFNLSPSTQWAAYGFSAYRQGMRAADVAPPRVETRAGADSLELEALLDLSFLQGSARLGLSAVIEEKSGAKSYWALAHPPGKPDFHHSDCFALELPPA
jgi:hypothetical protein